MDRLSVTPGKPIKWPIDTMLLHLLVPTMCTEAPTVTFIAMVSTAGNSTPLKDGNARRPSLILKFKALSRIAPLEVKANRTGISSEAVAVALHRVTVDLPVEHAKAAVAWQLMVAVECPLAEAEDALE